MRGINICQNVCGSSFVGCLLTDWLWTEQIALGGGGIKALYKRAPLSDAALPDWEIFFFLFSLHLLKKRFEWGGGESAVADEAMTVGKRPMKGKLMNWARREIRHLVTSSRPALERWRATCSLCLVTLQFSMAVQTGKDHVIKWNCSILILCWTCSTRE